MRSPPLAGGAAVERRMNPRGRLGQPVAATERSRERPGDIPQSVLPSRGATDAVFDFVERRESIRAVVAVLAPSGRGKELADTMDEFGGGVRSQR
ncbi:MAG: hypothetical protein ABEH58_01390 [Haloplanus sp.]